ncbi:uncharacterized protein LOC129808779 [Phlebotomus papatasi]|uniref:uncharacterized protein LOC129808779 n=1 Tax=Phlebotomus papatasi TaxID=29031 RepID=UPI002484048F|nr:uncharacterized protein LOC129808779 [Phlebotomus papatasi]
MAKEVRINDTLMAKFIDELSQNKIIWNKRHRLYGRSDIREKAVQTLAKKLQISREKVLKLNDYVKKKYHDQDVKLKIKKSGGEPNDSLTEWKWYEACAFLATGRSIAKNTPQSQIIGRKALTDMQNSSVSRVIQHVVEDTRTEQNLPEVLIEHPANDSSKSQMSQHSSLDSITQNTDVVFSTISPRYDIPEASSYESPGPSKTPEIEHDSTSQLRFLSASQQSTSTVTSAIQRRETLINSVIFAIRSQLHTSDFSEEDLVDFHSDVIRYIINYRNAK